MNLELINDHIQYFRREIIDSGFKRDIDDYVSSLPSHQSNIITLRETASKVLTVLEHIYQSDLPEALLIIMPNEDQRPFTETQHYETLKQIVDDTEIDLPNFFTKFNDCLTVLKKQLQANQSALDVIQAFVAPYIAKNIDQISEDGVATISIVFKEHKTITNMGQFSKTITAWNKILPIYHQLLKSESPQDVQIVQVQNGSIDCIVNLDVVVSLMLVDLYQGGFEVFAAYLSYKNIIKPIIDSCHGNKKIIKHEAERVDLMLDNIGEAVISEINEQHKKAKKADKNIETTSIKTKVEQVANLITSHIVKGNDFKLLALPEREDTNDEKEKLADKSESLREQSNKARRQLRQTPQEAQQKLLDTYGEIEENDNK